MKLLNTVFILTITAFLAQNINSQIVPKVFTKGAMKDMGTTYDLKVWLDTLPDKSNLFAMGPYDKMKGEITVFKGKPFFASAFTEGKAVVSQSWDIRSPFFVYSNVKDWEEFQLMGTIGRIAGEFDELTTHIVTPRSPEIEGYKADIKSQKFILKNTPGELLGFYSEKHQGVFTGSTSFVHVHYIKDDQTFMGHLDEITTANKALKLYLPKKQTAIKTGMRVNDTDFSKGRLGNIQNIDLDDIVKFHGHLCDGLVVGHLALKQAMAELYPEGTVDRTNTRIVSKPSPCLTDAAIYLTGGRYQYNSFYVSDSIDGLFTVQRLDTGKTISVQLNNGVKPGEIDKLGAKAVKGELSACDLGKLKQLENRFSHQLLSTAPRKNFSITEIVDFEWDPELRNDFVKTDILNKEKLKCSE